MTRFQKTPREQVCALNKKSAAKRHAGLKPEDLAARMRKVRAGKSPGPFHPKE